MTQEQALALIKNLLDQVPLSKAGHSQVDQAIRIIQEGLKRQTSEVKAE